MEFWTLLFDISVLLSAALIAGTICSRLGQSPIVGYLFAGMLLGGAGGFDMVEAEHDLGALAELGVSLLMFSIGLEFSWKRLLRLGSRTLLVGVLQVVITMGVLAIVTLGFGLSPAESVAVGAKIGRAHV